MSCPHGKPRGRCEICRMEALEDYYGVPEDHIDDEEEEVRTDGSGREDSGSAFEPISPPTVSDIVHERVTKLWVRCPECRTAHELWPKEMKEVGGIPENHLIAKALDCYLSHSWTPDSWQEAHEKGLVPESWVESPDNDGTASPQEGDR